MRRSVPLVFACLPMVANAGDLLPPVSLTSGERYFRLGGTQTFLLGRNPTGWRVEQFAPLLQWAGESGDRIARVHLTIGWPMDAPPGEVDEAWAQRWDRVLDMAAGNGVYVLPVFGVWAPWNDGSRGEAWHSWEKNRYNAELGGPATRPSDVLADTECRRLWLKWLAALVGRWAARPNVLGWEVFSELDLVTGSTEAESAAFVERAAQVMRSADPFSRPITASLSGTRDWPTLSASPALDFLQVHPYGPNLSDLVLASVRDRLQRYRKPVFVGECGLSAGPPAGSLAAAPRAYIGVNHAIWATIVSGAMNGRMLWWEDGYDQYERLDLRTQYKDASSGAARFVEGVDFAGTGPLPCETPPDLTGAALGNDHLILGWFRDTHCRPPDWPTRPIQGATIALPVPGPDTSFVAECFATTSGDRLSTAILSAYDDRVVIPLPTFEGSIALKLRQPDSPAATGHPSG